MRIKTLRRNLIALIAALAVVISGNVTAQDEPVDSLVVAINVTPWLAGFQALVEAYEEGSGVEIELREFPFAQLNQRVRSAVTADTSEFDVIPLAEFNAASFFADGLVEPIHSIDPDFTLDPAILQYDGLTRWDQEAQFSTQDGQLLALPVNGTLQIFFYRADLYEEAGLEPPETWQDVMNAADQLARPDEGFYGFTVRGSAAITSISWDFYPYLRGMGGDLFADPPEDWSVVLNSPEGIAALELYLTLAHEYSPPNVASIGQAEEIALLSSGQLLQAIVSSGAYNIMDDPQQSTVVGDIQYAVVPRPVDGQHALASGVLSLAIPRNLPEERQQAALDFLKFATSYDAQVVLAEGGGIPVRTDVYESQLSEQEEFRYFEVMAASTPHIVHRARIPEAPQYEEILGTRLNQAVTGELTAEEAMNLAAQEIYEVMQEAGYETGLPYGSGDE